MKFLFNRICPDSCFWAHFQRKLKTLNHSAVTVWLWYSRMWLHLHNTISKPFIVQSINASLLTKNNMPLIVLCQESRRRSFCVAWIIYERYQRRAVYRGEPDGDLSVWKAAAEEKKAVIFSKRMLCEFRA